MNVKIELRRFARDSLYNFIRHGWAILFGLGTSILLARGLGKEARGLYTLAILLPEMLMIFSNLGLAAATVYLVGHGDYAPAEAIKNNFVISILLSLVTVAIGALVVTFGANWLFPNVPKNLLYLALAILPLMLLISALNAVFQGIHDFRSFNLFGMAAQLSLFIMVFLLVWIQKGGLRAAILAYLSANLFTLIFLLAFIGYKFKPFAYSTSRIDPQYGQKALSFGIPAHLGNIVTFLNYRLDTVILNLLTGPVAVGIYSVSVGLGERFWIPSSAIGSVLFPKIAALDGQEEPRKQLTPLMSRLVFWISAIIAILVWPFLDWMITTFYSPVFREAVLPLKLILPGTIFLNTTIILANDLNGRGKPQVYLYRSAIALCINIVSNIILIPRFGAAGAALSSTISYTILAVLIIHAYVRITRIHWQELLFLNRSDLTLVRNFLFSGRAIKSNDKLFPDP